MGKGNTRQIMAAFGPLPRSENDKYIQQLTFRNACSHIVNFRVAPRFANSHISKVT